MATISIFVSFEYDKDYDLKNNFLAQAKDHAHLRVDNSSLNEAYPTEYWKAKARAAIKGCHVVVVLIGQDTHNAPGVRVETDMALSFGKPIIQIRPQDKPFNGLPHLGEPIPWDWRVINRELCAIEI